jgi:hypothetical protein
MLLLWSKSRSRLSSTERRKPKMLLAASGQTAVNSGYRRWMILLCYGKARLPDLCVVRKQVVEVYSRSQNYATSGVFQENGQSTTEVPD